jgi:hypothetical protein
MFLLVWQFRVDLLLDPPKQKGPQHLVETVYDKQLLFLIQLHRFIASVLVNRHRKPLLEVVAAVEHLRQQEVEQSPKLAQIVLEGRASEEKTMVALVLLA